MALDNNQPKPEGNYDLFANNSSTSSLFNDAYQMPSHEKRTEPDNWNNNVSRNNGSSDDLRAPELPKESHDKQIEPERWFDKLEKEPAIKKEWIDSIEKGKFPQELKDELSSSKDMSKMVDAVNRKLDESAKAQGKKESNYKLEYDQERITGMTIQPYPKPSAPVTTTETVALVDKAKAAAETQKDGGRALRFPGHPPGTIDSMSKTTHQKGSDRRDDSPIRMLPSSSRRVANDYVLPNLQVG